MKTRTFRYFLPLPMLVLAIGCNTPSEKQIYWDNQKAMLRLEQMRFYSIYRESFKHGFLEAWAGRSGKIDTEGLIREASDPEGDFALQIGRMDGNSAGRNARMEHELQSSDKEDH
jgi:hypothetical protein